MLASEKSTLIESLKSGVVEVTFTKISTGEVRVMPCTVNPDILLHEGISSEIKDQNPDSEHLVVYALDKKAWRSFISNTVTGWKKV